MISDKFLLAGIIILADLLVSLYYRKAFHTISIKMILEHVVLISALLTVFILIPGIPLEILMLADAVLIYFDFEQLHTGHTILNVWERRFILGIVIVWMLLFMGIGITGSVLGAAILVRIVYLVAAFADRVVKSSRGTDVELSDLEVQTIKTAMSIGSGYVGAVDPSYFIILVLTVLQGYLTYRLFGSVSFPAFDRLLYFCLGLGALILIVHSPLLTLLKIEYYEFVNIDGVIPNLLLEGRSRLLDRVPAGYSEENVREIVRKYHESEGSIPGGSGKGSGEPSAEPTAGSQAKASGCGSEAAPSEKPDIIVIMNESFSDLRVNGEFETSRPVMPFYDSLKSDPEILSGFSHVSILGGNTAYSEYEFLTGDSTRFYKYCPYSSKIIPPGITIHALPSHLKALGYKTVASHSYLRENWRRPVVYGNLGFEEQHYIDDFPPENVKKVRSFCSDESHYMEIIRQLEEADDNRPVFSFNITMQNHGGYAPDAILPDRIGVSVNGKEFPEASTYETLMNISDSAIHILTDYLATRKRPCILLFFGDHQPKFIQGFMEEVLGHPENEMTEEEMKRLYITPYFIWSNRPLDRSLHIKELSLNYMGGYLLRLAGLPLTGYMRYLEDIRKEQPVITRRAGEAPPGYESLIYSHIRGREAGAEGFF